MKVHSRRVDGMSLNRSGRRTFVPALAAHLTIGLLLAALCAPIAGAEEFNPVLAVVNGKPVTRWEVQLEIERLLPRASYHGRVSDEAWERVVTQAVEDAIGNELACQEALARGVKIPEKPVDQVEKGAIRQAGSRKELEKRLRAEGLTLDDFREFQKKKLLAAKRQAQVLAEIAEAIALADADLAKYYEENKEKFALPPSVDAQHLLISVPPWASKEEWAQGERRARWIAKRARAKEDFTKLVETYSGDKESKKTGGKLKSMHGGRFAATIESAVAKIEPGEVAEPVKSIYGFHVVKLLARNPRRQLAFEEIDKEQLRNDLRARFLEEGMESWQNGLREKAEVVFDQNQVDLFRSEGRTAKPAFDSSSQ